MAVPGHALEVGVELEVVDRVLVVAFHEADRRDPLAEHPEDPEGDLVLVRAHHLDAAAVGLEHGSVVDPHPVGVGHRRQLVGIDGADPKTWVAPSQDLHHVLGASPLPVLGLVEVGELHVLAEAVDHALGLRRGREDALAGEVEVRVVEHEGDVGERDDAERRDHDASHVGQGGEPPEARLQREPQADHEQDGERHEPAHEPDGVDDVQAVHGVSAAPAPGRSGRVRRGRS